MARATSSARANRTSSVTEPVRPGGFVVAENTPAALTAVTRRHSSSVMPDTGPANEMPTLATRTSSRSYRSSAAATASSQSAGSVTQVVANQRLRMSVRRGEVRAASIAVDPQHARAAGCQQVGACETDA